jgi:hypothetical protein
MRIFTRAVVALWAGPESAGVIFIAENGEGAGVRMAKGKAKGRKR